MVAAREKMERVAAELPTKSAKIRALHREGFSRSEIARQLDIRYQFVRNVLVQEEARKAKAAQPKQDASGEAAKLPPTKVRVGPEGRVVIPAPFREALGLKEGDVLVALAEDGEVHLLTGAAAIRRARAIVRAFVPAGVSLVDELLEDRRREVERETQDG